MLTFLCQLLLGSLETYEGDAVPRANSTRSRSSGDSGKPYLQSSGGRQMTESVEEDLAHAFAEDMGTESDYIVPRLVAHLILTLYSRSLRNTRGGD